MSEHETPITEIPAADTPAEQSEEAERPKSLQTIVTQMAQNMEKMDERHDDAMAKFAKELEDMKQGEKLLPMKVEGRDPQEDLHSAAQRRQEDDGARLVARLEHMTASVVREMRWHTWDGYTVSVFRRQPSALWEFAICHQPDPVETINWMIFGGVANGSEFEAMPSAAGAAQKEIHKRRDKGGAWAGEGEFSEEAARVFKWSWRTRMGLIFLRWCFLH